MTRQRANVQNVPLTFIPKLKCFLEPNPWKVAWGGRGGGKTETMSKMLLFMGTQLPLRVLCAREYMASIRESSWQALVDAIGEMRLQDFYLIEKAEIRSKNPVRDPDDPKNTKFTTFRFTGIKNNPQNLKSSKGIDICMIDEAAGVTHRSWEVLIPTIHRKGQTLERPEIWVSFNPDYETDATYQMFVAKPKYPTACVVQLSYRDNPWFPAALEEARLQLLHNDPDAHEHVYEGKCRRFLEGAIYRDQLRECEANRQIRDVDYDSLGGEVIAAFDIGLNDATAIWIAQRVGQEVHLLHYLEDQQKALDYWLMRLNEISRKDQYPIDRLWLPHDARAREFGTGKSTEEILRTKGYKVGIVPKLMVQDGINAVRGMFPRCYFDQSHCAEGLKALGNYRFEVADQKFGGLKNAPVHDRWSHGADAFRYLALALKPPRQKPQMQSHAHWSRFMQQPNTSWMNL